MAVSRKLTIVFIFFYLIVIIYLLLFLFVPNVQVTIIESRLELTRITEGTNYFWAIIISLVICFLGSASIGFPIPFPFVLFSLSNSIFIKYLNIGLNLGDILLSSNFWFEILGLAIAGGLGSSLGELTGYMVGYGTKKIAEERHSDLLNNINGFGKMILQN